MTDLDKVIGKLEHSIKLLTERLARAQAELLEDPEKVFSSDVNVKRAATLAIHRRMLNALTAPDSNATLETLREYALNQALSGAKHVSHSSSGTTNLMDSYKTGVWADSIDRLHGILWP